MNKQGSLVSVKAMSIFTFPTSWQKWSDTCLLALLLVMESIANTLQTLDEMFGLKG